MPPPPADGYATFRDVRTSAAPYYPVLPEFDGRRRYVGETFWGCGENFHRRRLHSWLSVHLCSAVAAVLFALVGLWQVSLPAIVLCVLIPLTVAVCALFADAIQAYLLCFGDRLPGKVSNLTSFEDGYGDEGETIYIHEIQVLYHKACKQYCKTFYNQVTAPQPGGGIPLLVSNCNPKIVCR